MRKLFALIFLGFLVPLCSLSAVAAHSPAQDKCKESFSALLKEYKRFPVAYMKKIDPAGRPREDLDPRAVANLSENVLKSRCAQYNATYVNYRKVEVAVEKQLKVVQARLEATAVADFKQRSELEVRAAATRDKLEQVRTALFLWSIDANNSLHDALQTVPAEKRVVKEPTVNPKMPGVFGGALVDRQKMGAGEKINLTPIDPDFYQTQLGKKLESDLGGRAQYWSYDFNADELYVKVGSDIGKLRVRGDSSGVRFIQTRVGSAFIEPKGSDVRVNMLTAKGRFLTGDQHDETLFGKMPKDTGPSFVDENKSSDKHD